MQYRKSIRYYHFIINAFNHNSLLTTKISNQEVIHEIIFHILKYLNLNSFSIFQECPAGYHGPHCNESCPFPSYGVLCRLRCTCGIGYCHNAYGCYIKKTTGMRQMLECTFDMIIQRWHVIRIFVFTLTISYNNVWTKLK